jgi:hypothetical protein
MQRQDIALFGKKVLVGIALTVLPLAILLGGLRLTRHILTTFNDAKQSASQTK